MVLSDLSRSSTKKAAANKRAKDLVKTTLQETEGEELTAGLELHRRMLFEVYGQALSGGWAPREIGLDWLVPELRKVLGSHYDDDYFRIVYDGEFRPGLTAASQQQYTATAPTRDIMREAWPVPENTSPLDPEMVAQALTTLQNEHHHFTDDDDEDDDATVRKLFAGKHSGDRVDLNDIDDEHRPVTGKKRWPGWWTACSTCSGGGWPSRACTGARLGPSRRPRTCSTSSST